VVGETKIGVGHEPEPGISKADRRAQAKEEAYYVASQWQLIWWKFRKHRLANLAWPIIIVLYVCAAFAGFLSPTLPGERFPDYVSAPPQIVRIHDGERFRWPFIYDITRSTDPETFRRTYALDRSKTYTVRLFTKGQAYKVLGLFPSDIHLFGTDGGPLFLLGTDKLGRDMLTRILYGSRISLSIGLVGVVLTFTLGLMLGGLSGYLGGLADTIIQRTIDTLVCVPTIPLWMGLAAAVPRDWPPLRIYFAIVIITSVIGWAGLARVVRGKVLSARQEEFVMAARIAGVSNVNIIVKHMLPAITSYVIVSITLSIPGTILGETSLSFLGLGLQPPVVSWGVLLQDAQKLETIAHHPWLLWPAAWIAVTVLTFNFLGDGLRDAADPYR